jgi:hypothetical protein
LYPRVPQPDGRKTCLSCGNEYPATRDYWHRNNTHADGLASHCRTCRNEAKHAYDLARTEQKARQRILERQALRLGILTHYSGGIPKCACCGEEHWEFLALDHIKGGGYQQRLALGRSSHGLYRWLRAQGYPEGYRVLCRNCNMARGFYGLCRHERERTAVAG